MNNLKDKSGECHLKKNKNLIHICHLGAVPHGNSFNRFTNLFFFEDILIDEAPAKLCCPCH